MNLTPNNIITLDEAEKLLWHVLRAEPNAFDELEIRKAIGAIVAIRAERYARLSIAREAVRR